MTYRADQYAEGRKKEDSIQSTRDFQELSTVERPMTIGMVFKCLDDSPSLLWMSLVGLSSFSILFVSLFDSFLWWDLLYICGIARRQFIVLLTCTDCRLPSLSLNSFHERPFPGVHLDDPDPVHDGPRNWNALVCHFGNLGSDVETYESHTHEGCNQQNNENIEVERFIAKQIPRQPKCHQDCQYPS